MIRDNMKYSEKNSNRLNNLLEKTYDAEKGYKTAQEKVDDPTARKFLKDRVQQRYNFGHELKSEILQYGQLPEKGGSIKGDLHRTWMNIKAVVPGNETKKIMEEVERGEKASLEEYNEIINDSDITLPPSTERLLVKQRNAIQASINTAKMYGELTS